MPHCTKCGTEVPETAQFCQKCGQPQVGAPPNPGYRSAAPPFQPATSGLSENAAATLSYVLGWLTGIIFYLIDRRPYVRFHAAQSIVTFGGLHIIRAIIAGVFGFGWFFGGFHPYRHFGPFGPGFGPGVGRIGLIRLISFIVWNVCSVKPYKREQFMIPVDDSI